MADEKRGKGGGPGPFEPGRCYEVDARLGHLYEARNVATGTPALTLIPRDDVEWQPGGPVSPVVSRYSELVHHEATECYLEHS